MSCASNAISPRLTQAFRHAPVARARRPRALLVLALVVITLHGLALWALHRIAWHPPAQASTPKPVPVYTVRATANATIAAPPAISTPDRTPNSTPKSPPDVSQVPSALPALAAPPARVAAPSPAKKVVPSTKPPAAALSPPGISTPAPIRHAPWAQPGLTAPAPNTETQTAAIPPPTSDAPPGQAGATRETGHAAGEDAKTPADSPAGGTTGQRGVVQRPVPGPQGTSAYARYAALPTISPLMQRMGEDQGDVTLRLLIGKDGQVLQAQTLKPSGFSRLDNAVLTAAKQSSYAPALCDGTPVTSWWSVTYRVGQDSAPQPASGAVDCKNLLP